MGGPKHFLFYEGTAEIQQGFKLPLKKAKFLAKQQPICVNQNVWLEEFFCERHGKMWLLISRSQQGEITSRPATREDWNRTSNTFNPDRPNCSVSDFTCRMSRGSSLRLIE
ncbi:hypothetical protein [Crocosphaera sp. Alani8]|uniref:hypothetical protein n=1 Tax=Crocosphaera sp. Alani8 TaxID=3038952 RepID=UPI00313EF6EE